MGILWGDETIIGGRKKSKWRSLLTPEEEKLKGKKGPYTRDEEKRVRESLSMEERKQAGWEKTRKDREPILSNPSYSLDSKRESLRLTNSMEEIARKDKSAANIELSRELRDKYLAGKTFTEKEVNEWRKQYPSTTVNRRVDGDVNYGAKFRGEGSKLLYELKNHMKLGNQDQLRMTRVFTDGTIVTAWSIFGQDFIKIDTTRVVITDVTKTVEDQVCTITFLDFPLYVPPMKNPGKIETDEVEGVDYFKSYYTIDVSKCSKCNDIGWEFLFTYLQSSPLVPAAVPISTRIEWPVEPLHHHQLDPVSGLFLDHPADQSDHTIYSLEPPAWGQVISRGTDSGGTYIIWKAYTESIKYSRTGLAIMRLVARIRDSDGIEICSQNERIEVDCCLKDTRPVEIWWEDFGTCEPYIPYPGVVYNAICKMPTQVPYWGTSGLVWYGCTQPQQPLYAIPEINGSCLPVEWTLTGPISLWNSDKNDNLIYFKCEEAGCTESATITLRDRCGTSYFVRAAPCCEEAEELTLGYTSLLMACSGSQDFTHTGGCAPYVWSATGGTIDQTGHYHAPATNANCTSNPTITVTDCCGNSVSISLAVNCSTATTIATGLGIWLECSGCWCSDRGCDQGISGCFDWIITRYQCDGTQISSCETRPCGTGNPPCNGITAGWHQHPCTDCSPTGCPPASCWTNQCSGVCPNPLLNLPCGAGDCRTAAQKLAGCCPLNPLTGLPY